MRQRIPKYNVRKRNPASQATPALAAEVLPHRGALLPEASSCVDTSSLSRYRARYSWPLVPWQAHIIGIFTELGNQRPLVLDACSLCGDIKVQNAWVRHASISVYVSHKQDIYNDAYERSCYMYTRI